jgi:hypothetical protein
MLPQPMPFSVGWRMIDGSGMERLYAQRQWLSDPVPHFFNWYLKNPELHEK